MEMFWLYLILQLDSIRSLFQCGCVLALFMGTVGCFAYYGPFEGRNKLMVVVTVLLFIVCNIMLALIPTSKSATILAGAYAVKEAAQTETAQRLASKSVKLIEDWLTSLEPVMKGTK